ncbi:MAG: MFS transporter [Planctomycetota bacterium]|nr:MAG: MFS transporter [Planctomycetota bacterium]
MGLAFLTVVIDLLGFGIVLPLLPRYGTAFGAHDVMLGLLLASFSLMQFLCSPMWGRLSDRIGRRPVLMIGLTGSAVFYGLFGFATQLGPSGRWLGLSALAWLFVSRIGGGLAAATIPTAQAYIADCTSEEERGRGMAMIGAAFGVGFTFGPLLGAVFVPDSLEAPPSPAPGYLAAGLSTLALCLAAVWLPESLAPELRGRTGEPRGWLRLGGVGRAFRRPALAIAIVTMFLSVFAFGQFEVTLPLLTERLGLPDRQNFLVFAYIGFVLTLAQGLLVRRLIPRVGEKRMAIAGAALMAVGVVATLACLPDGGVEREQSLRDVWPLFAVLPVCIVGFGAITPSVQALVSLAAERHEQGEMLGVAQSMSSIARIVAPVVGIPLFQVSPTVAYLEATCVMLAGAGLLAFLRDPRRHGRDTVAGTQATQAAQSSAAVTDAAAGD